MDRGKKASGLDWSKAGMDLREIETIATEKERITNAQVSILNAEITIRLGLKLKSNGWCETQQTYKDEHNIISHVATDLNLNLNTSLSHNRLLSNLNDLLISLKHNPPPSPTPIPEYRKESTTKTMLKVHKRNTQQHHFSLKDTKSYSITV